MLICVNQSGLPLFRQQISIEAKQPKQIRIVDIIMAFDENEWFVIFTKW